jgi:hypothetical protein
MHFESTDYFFTLVYPLHLTALMLIILVYPPCTYKMLGFGSVETRSNLTH